MARRGNYGVAANGIPAGDWGDAKRDAARTAGASSKDAQRQGSKAYREAANGGARKK
jgi:hypothetical protein